MGGLVGGETLWVAGAPVGTSTEVGGDVPGCVASVGSDEGGTVSSIGAVDDSITGGEVGAADRRADGAVVGTSPDVGGGVPDCVASVGPDEGGAVLSTGAVDGFDTGEEVGEADGGEPRSVAGAVVRSSDDVGGDVPDCVASVGPDEGGTVSSIGAVDGFAAGEEVGEADGGEVDAEVGSSTEVGGGVPGCVASLGPDEGGTVSVIGAVDEYATGNEVDRADGGDGSVVGFSIEVGGDVPRWVASMGPDEGGIVSVTGAVDGPDTGEEVGGADGKEPRWVAGAAVGSSTEVGGDVSGCVASVGPDEGGTVSTIGAVDVFVTGEEVGGGDGETRWVVGAVVGSSTGVGGSVPAVVVLVGPEEGGAVCSAGAAEGLATGEEAGEASGRAGWAVGTEAGAVEGFATGEEEGEADGREDGAVVRPSTEVGGDVSDCVASVDPDEGGTVSTIGAVDVFVVGEEVGGGDGETRWVAGAVVGSSTGVGGGVSAVVASVGPEEGGAVCSAGAAEDLATGDEVGKVIGEVNWAVGAEVGCSTEVGGDVPDWAASVGRDEGGAVISIGAVDGLATGESVGREARSAVGALVGSSALVGGDVSGWVASVDPDEGGAVSVIGAVDGFATGEKVDKINGEEVRSATGVEVGLFTKITGVLGCAVSAGPEVGVAVFSVAAVGDALGAIDALSAGDQLGDADADDDDDNDSDEEMGGDVRDTEGGAVATMVSVISPSTPSQGSFSL